MKIYEECLFLIHCWYLQQKTCSKKNYEWFTDYLVLKAMRQLLELLYSGSPIKPVLEQLIKKNSRKNVVYLLFHEIKYRIVSMCQ